MILVGLERITDLYGIDLVFVMNLSLLAFKSYGHFPSGMCGEIKYNWLQPA